MTLSDFDLKNAPSIDQVGTDPTPAQRTRMAVVGAGIPTNLASAPAIDSMSLDTAASTQTPAQKNVSPPDPKPGKPVDTSAIEGIIKEEGADQYAPTIRAIFGQESGGNPNSATSVNGAHGGMQVIPATFAAMMGTNGDPTSKEDQLRAGVRYAKQLGDQFGGNSKAIAAAYFSGPGNASNDDVGFKDGSRQDGNGKTVSSYVQDVVGRMGANGTAAPAPAAAKGPMKWAAVEQHPDFLGADKATREAMRSQYFADVVAPQVPTEMLDAVKKQFDEDTAPSLGKNLVAGAHDLGLSVAKGTGGLIKSGGTLAGLATGDLDHPFVKAVQTLGDTISKNATADQSAGRRYADGKIDERMADAPDTIVDKAVTLAAELVKDPLAAANFTAEQVPQLVPGGVVGRGLGLGLKAAGIGGRAAAKLATGGAVSAGAALQGSDAAQNTYDKVMAAPDVYWQAHDGYNEMIQSGKDPAVVKAEIATGLAQQSFAKAATASALLAALPGGATLERALAGSAGKVSAKAAAKAAEIGAVEAGVKGVVKGVGGEGFNEGMDEGLSQRIFNEDIKTVITDHDVNDGVADNTARGAALGGLMGAPTGAMHGMHARVEGLHAAVDRLRSDDPLAARDTLGKGRTSNRTPAAAWTVTDSVEPEDQAARALPSPSRAVSGDWEVLDKQGNPVGTPLLTEAKPVDTIDGEAGIVEDDKPVPANRRLENAPTQKQLPAPEKTDEIVVDMDGTARFATPADLDQAGRAKAAADNADSGTLAVDSAGVSRPMSVAERAVVDEAAAKGKADGLTPDVIRAQQQRALNEHPAVLAENEVRAEIGDRIERAAKDVNLTPTEAQKKAGTYEKGHFTAHGLDFALENSIGSQRTGKDAGGKKWSVDMTAHYGYLNRTEGNDGDHLDAYVAGGFTKTDPVYVVDQKDIKTGAFDEHKLVFGARSLAQATALYDAHFSDGKGAERRSAVTATTIPALRDWVAVGDQKKPFSQTVEQAPAAEAAQPVEQVERRAAPKPLEKMNKAELLAYAQNLDKRNRTSDLIGRKGEVEPSAPDAEGEAANRPPPKAEVRRLESRGNRRTDRQPAPSISVAHAERLAKDFKAAFAGAADLDIHVVETVADLPSKYRASPYAEGVYHLDDGSVYLVASNLTNEAHAKAILAHEIIGHYGMESLLGAGFNKVLDDVMRVAHAKSEVTEEVSPRHLDYATMEAVRQQYPEVDDRALAREVLARMAETNVKPGFIDRVYNLLRAALRKLGLIDSFSKSELKQMVVDAGNELRAGKSSPVRAKAAQQGVAESASAAPVFVSALVQAINQKAPFSKAGEIDAAQLSKWLDARALDGTVKRDELEATGIKDYLALVGGKVSREAVAGFLKENGIKVETKILGADLDPAGMARRKVAWDKYTARLQEIAESIPLTRDRDWQQRNVLIQEREELSIARDKEADDAYPLPSATRHGDRTLPGGSNYRELLLTLPDRSRADHNFVSPFDHFREPNILAHIRFNDRADTDGKRVLFIEEIQSDFAQAKRAGAEVPAAPFIGKTEAWVALALKRAIRYASENDYDRIAFTTGGQQVARAGLEMSFDRVRYRKTKGGEWEVLAFDVEGKPVFDDGAVDRTQLVEALGPNVAARIAASAVTKWSQLTDLDRKVGGEGMRAFYDAIVPNVANDVLKKLGGGRVGPVDLRTPDAEGSQGDASADERIGIQPGFDITAKLHDTVMRGMPLFSVRREGASLESNLDDRRPGRPNLQRRVERVHARAEAAASSRRSGRSAAPESDAASNRAEAGRGNADSAATRSDRGGSATAGADRHQAEAGELRGRRELRGVARVLDGPPRANPGDDRARNEGREAVEAQTAESRGGDKRDERAFPNKTGLLDLLLRKAGGEAFAEHVTSPLFDRVIALAGHIVPETVKAGLVSDYGLSEDYLDAKWRRGASINRRLRTSKNLLDVLSSLDTEQSRVAYLWMTSTPDLVAEQRMLERLPAESRETLTRMKDQIDDLGREAVDAGLISEETCKRNENAYLHRSYARFEAESAGKDGANWKRAATLRADSFKGRGIREDVSEDALLRHAATAVLGDRFTRMEKRDASGKLRRVEYVPADRSVPAAFADWHNAGSWEARWVDKNNKVGLWRDLTADERQKLGEIEEVRYAFARTVLQATHDVEMARFLNWVGDEYAQDDAPADKTKPASEGFVSLATYKPDEWVRVPESSVPGTPIKRYGALAGRYIPGPMWNDLRSTVDFRASSDIGRLYQTLLQAWKISKTALSPAVHMNNVMSNFVLADIADVRPTDLLRSLKTMHAAHGGDEEASALMDRFADSGADQGNAAAADLHHDYVKPLLDELEKAKTTETTGDLTAAQIVGMATQGHIRDALKAFGGRTTFTWGSKAFRAMLDVYKAEDDVFRLAKFIKETDAGRSDADAGRMARDAFLNYEINAPWVQAARRTGVLPFVAFSYRAIPKLIEASAKQPWKVAKYAGVFAALQALAYAALGLGDADRDREERLLRHEQQGKMLGLFPRMLRMPWNGDGATPVFLDMRRWVPGGDMFEIAPQSAGPIPNWLAIGGPLSLASEVLMNKSAFTGQPIVKETDTAGERTAKLLDWSFKAVAPNMPLPNPISYATPGLDRGQGQTYGWSRIDDAIRGKTSALGREGSLPAAVAASLGVKVDAVDPAEERLRIAREVERREREIKGNVVEAARLHQRHGLNDEEFEAVRARNVKKLNETAAEAAGRLRWVPCSESRLPSFCPISTGNGPNPRLSCRCTARLFPHAFARRRSCRRSMNWRWKSLGSRRCGAPGASFRKRTSPSSLHSRGTSRASCRTSVASVTCSVASRASATSTPSRTGRTGQARARRACWSRCAPGCGSAWSRTPCCSRLKATSNSGVRQCRV